MKKSNLYQYRLEQEILGLLNQHKMNCATIEIKIGKYNNYEDKTIVITPIVEKAADIIVHVVEDCDGIDMVCGKGTNFEIMPQGNSYLKLSSIEEFKEIFKTVLKGNFEEEILFNGDSIIKTVGKLKINGKEIKIEHSNSFFNPFLKAKIEKVKYEPY